MTYLRLLALTLSTLAFLTACLLFRAWRHPPASPTPTVQYPDAGPPERD